MNKYKRDMSIRLSKVDNQFLNNFCLKYHITPEYKPTAPLPHHRITDCPDGYIALYTKHFDFANLRIPFSNFFLEFLKQYNLNISQLSPLGVIKVTHFEIVCRALGGEPSLPLFRKFFIIACYGDWYTVERLKSPVPSCVSRVPSDLKEWRNSFFWVSAEVIPFKMHWREPGEPLNVIRLRTETFDEELYRKLVDHPMDLRTFPEHVLILTGLSRNWPYVDAEPIFKDGDDEIGLLNYLKKKSDGGVKCTRRSLAEKEDNILDRTRGICYEAKGLARVQPEVLASSSKRMRLEKSESWSGDDTIRKRRYCDIVYKRSAKRRGKKIVLSELDDVTTMDGPKSDKDDASKRLRRKIVYSESGEPSDDGASKSDPLNGLGRIKQLVGSVPELLKWQDGKAKKEGRLRGQISKYRVRMSLQQAKNTRLEKKVKKLKNVKRLALEKVREAIETVAKNTVEHAKVVGALQKELEGEREMVEKLKGELKVERRDKVSLGKSLERVSSERRWLIQEGFEYVINRLHRSEEYLKPLGVVLSKLWSSGAHAGVVAGYARCKDGVAFKDVGLYKPEAEEEFLKAVHELEHTRFPYVAALSQCTDRMLDDLKALEPIGMEDIK